MRVKKPSFSTKTLLSIAMVLLIFVTCVPVMMNTGLIRNVAQLLSIALFLCGIAISNNKGYLIVGGSVAILLIIFANALYGSINGLLSVSFNVCTDLAFISMGLFLSKNGEKRFCRRALYLLLIVYGVTAITTIFGLIEYPLAVRELGRSVESYSRLTGADFDNLKRQYRSLNIATFSQLYGMVFAIPSFLYAFAKSRKKVYIIGAVICELCVCKAQVTFALLLSFVLIGLCIMKPGKKRGRLKFLAPVIFAGLIALLNLKPLLLLLIGITSDNDMSMLSSKLSDLYYLLNGEIRGDATSRFGLYKLSVDVFQNHPLFGQSLWGTKNIDFSGHSEFLDYAGFYGLFGISIVAIFIVFYFRHIRHSCECKWLFIATFVGFLALYIFNLVWLMPQVYLGTFVLPALISRAYYMEGEKKA